MPMELFLIQELLVIWHLGHTRYPKEELMAGHKQAQLVLTEARFRQFLLRQEKKIMPQHPQYFSLFAEMLLLPYVGSFQKECLDVSFWYNDLAFTLTLSLAHSPERDQLFQFELEFDGHRFNLPLPNLHQILTEFECVAGLVLPFEVQRFTTHQKLEWLLNRRMS